jgi:putative transposase
MILFRPLNGRSDLTPATTKAMSPEPLNALYRQHKNYSSWSYRLHAGNVAALVKERPELGDALSYSTVKRRMKKRGWYKKSSRGRKTKGQKQALDRLEQREVRGYESSHAHALWHLDFHQGRLRIIDARGEWHTPMALCVLDDRSRLCCHIQRYLNETAEVLHHGLIQAFHKRGLPRSLMTDNGSAMLAHETKNGLLDLGVEHDKILAYSPYQNGKQESFWGQLEGRLLAMLYRDESLTLDFLNRATQAWAEMEYNRSLHEEISCSPLERLPQGPDCSRPSPDSEKLRFAFTIHESRSQRQSDGALQIKGARFETPSRFRHFKRLHVRYQSWDLSTAWLVDERTGDLLARIYPLDKTKNAHGKRRTLSPLPEDTHLPDEADSGPHPPLLRKLLAEYAATGLPPAYIPKRDPAESPGEAGNE